MVAFKQTKKARGLKVVNFSWKYSLTNVFEFLMLYKNIQIFALYSI